MKLKRLTFFRSSQVSFIVISLYVEIYKGTKCCLISHVLSMQIAVRCLGHPPGSSAHPTTPDNYPNNRECVFKIIVEVNMQIMLNVTDFELEGFSSCGFDYLEIRWGTFLTSWVIDLVTFWFLNTFLSFTEMEAMKHPPWLVNIVEQMVHPS